MKSSEHRSGFVALVGPANAGKSTLLNAVLGQKISIVSPKPQTTRNRVIGIKDGPDYQIVFVDTPGIFNESKVRRNRALGNFLKRQIKDALVGIDFTVLVLDVTRILKDGRHFTETVERFRSEFKVSPQLVLFNKIDRVEKSRLLPLMHSCHEYFSETSPDTELIPISAKEKDGLKNFESYLLKRLPVGVQYYPEGQGTDQSDEAITAEIIREKLFQQLNDEIPYSVAVRIERWVDEDTLSRISAVISVERESQKPIVIGAGGSKLKKIGTAARKELERLFGVKIFLELFVRVEEQWTRSDKGLRKVGLR